MREQEIKPHKITKPIQLLSAWLVGLVLINGSFIGAAIALGTQTYLSSVLIFASIINVPIFIISIFLLQTKYRPEMQEDTFYATYLDKKTNRHVEMSRIDIVFSKLEAIENVLRQKERSKISNDKTTRKSDLRIEVNDHIPMLEELKALLKSNNMSIHGYFGSVHGNSAPEVWRIAISEHIDLNLIAQLLKELPKVGISKYTIFDPLTEPAPADLYIGAYGTGHDSELNEDVLEKLEEWTSADFQLYTSSKLIEELNRG